MRLAPRDKRRGLTLLEVIVALAIFLFSIVAISELVNFGNDRALDTQFYQQAAFLCKGKLAEISTGFTDAQSQSETSFEDGGMEWFWSCECDKQTDVAGLWKVQVTVSRDSGYGQKASVTLSQFVMDPTLRGSTFDSPPQGNTQLDPDYTAPKDSSSSSSSSGGSGASGSGNTGGSKAGGNTGGSKAGGNTGGSKTGGMPGGGKTGGGKTGGGIGSTPGGGTGGSGIGSTPTGGGTKTGTGGTTGGGKKG